MGRHLVDKMLEKGYKVTILNRGNEYWGTSDPFGDRVKKILCDRKKRELFTQMVKEETNRIGTWDIVVDFSSYKAKDMEAAVAAVYDHVKMYVYISSDSTYMVSKPANRPPKEEDAIRPEDPKRKRKIERRRQIWTRKIRM
eukprot:TRINITY_DN6229_c0_g1_i2.p2 TRINITY_DN6229_c0_g1~~TRINITY_DN6229_c0_g1_i2.p2  ORF type:complete len:141 (-),score=30.37 TRINITY_DN6229_c0_g1_i2:294-716(-)